ncbi:type II secretion system major pseudopilin GspG [Maricaulaceae bacterium EIL42A08]|nr:type II secretion system major pseudopilin GspG [Maricaulaceae bacterium EIL42A08]
MRTRKPEFRRSDAGITLMEILVVLVIMTVVAAFVAPRVIGYISRSQEDVAVAQMGSIATSLELFYIDVGRYPTEDEGLQSLVEAPEELESWRGPYLRQASGLIDPWGEPYGYSLTTDGVEGFALVSYGRDKVPGGDGPDSDIIRQ